MAEITISVERFEQLVAAEREAKIIKTLLKDKRSHYSKIEYNEVDMLCRMLGVEEED